MKKLILFCLIVSGLLHAEVINAPASQALLAKQIPIVDIRTPGEWKETGLVKGSIPIMFFDEKGSYNVDRFMLQLKAKVDTTKPFALICRTGSRTSMLAPFLAQTYGYTVYNLQGGIMTAYRAGLPIVPYQ
ncbi:rhodanese-like domain-containing protein [Sulfurimonas sp. HSL-3221]|uniref:rhodanese-like domain-containing protein n=1 Tax=Sulfurimonadaceae TaxID=2771471 RepID=UPI001E457E56|nr:rhodanese-like domain-containing protein [Sulfurimonas sp. HSL-3221]UFS61958.1 rhodanese-like domain-containing protein [Sulfurimonas sp. HSL-3221]